MICFHVKSNILGYTAGEMNRRDVCSFGKEANYTIHLLALLKRLAGFALD